MNHPVSITFLAIALGILLAYAGTEILRDSAHESADETDKQIVKAVARSGLQNILSQINAIGLSDEGALPSIRSSGFYTASIDTHMFGDLTISVHAVKGRSRHTINANLIFETPWQAAIALNAARLSVTGTGDYTISGLDRRMPSRASRKGFLPPVDAIVTNSEENLREIVASLNGDRIIGANGSGSWSVASTKSTLAELYAEAVTGKGSLLLRGIEGGTFGSPDAPAIVHVIGDFTPSTSFSGTGLLIVDDGNFVVGQNFRWQGIVMIRKSVSAPSEIRLGSGAQIFGSLVAFEDTLGPVETLSLKIETGSEVHYSPESIAKIGQEIASIRRSSMIVVTSTKSFTEADYEG